MDTWHKDVRFDLIDQNDQVRGRASLDCHAENDKTWRREVDGRLIGRQRHANGSKLAATLILL